MKNQGISLIALIITIIVIIILAAIVIFTGLGTPESAQFSAFTNDVDTVYMAVMDKFADLKVQHTLSGDYRTNEQIYIEIAQGKAAADQYTVMNTDGTTAGSAANGIGNGDAGTGCINIQKDNTLLTVRLPKVREDENYWYILKDGRVFNETGYLYNGKTYVNSTFYYTNETTSAHDEERATDIASKMLADNPDFNMGEYSGS